MSVVDEARKIRNLLIEKNEADQWTLSSDKSIGYPSIGALIAKNSALLKKPLPNTLADIKDIIEMWRAEAVKVDQKIERLMKSMHE